jgi:signal transduction histidine kinase
MTLERRLILTSLLVALPVATLAGQATIWLRNRDLATSIQRVVEGQINAQTRERCEGDPTWFLTGLLEGRPRPTDPKPGPDDPPARPRPEHQPYELFAYDEEFIASSPIGPKFPPDFKFKLRFNAESAGALFDEPGGTGAEYAARTGWSPGPCAILLGRMHALPNGGFYWWLAFFTIEFLMSGIFVAVGTPLMNRIQAVSQAAREAARSEWTVVVPAEGHDELTAVGATLNEASADLRRRITDIHDREETHRRFVARAASEIGGPLDTLVGSLSGAPAAADQPSPLQQAHDISLHFGNISAAARLRMHLGPTALEPVDLNALVDEAASRLAGLARAGAVTIDVVRPSEPLLATADASLVRQALFNLVDNAIRYNRKGGRVVISLAQDDRAFVLRVTDNGPGVSDEQLASMTAIRRFRGDEGRADRPRQRGLGLALVWEVAERCGFALVLSHASGGGLECELRGTAAGH